MDRLDRGHKTVLVSQGTFEPAPMVAAGINEGKNEICAHI